MLTIVSGLIGGAITGRIFTPKVAIAEDGTQGKVLTVEELRIVDKDGKLLIKLGKDNSNSINGYGLLIYDKNGTAEADIRVDTSGGRICISGKNNRGVANINVDESGGLFSSFGIRSDGAISIATMGHNESGGTVRISGKDCKVKAAMEVNESGNGAIGLWDKNGKKLK